MLHRAAFTTRCKFGADYALDRALWPSRRGRRPIVSRAHRRPSPHPPYGQTTRRPAFTRHHPPPAIPLVSRRDRHQGAQSRDRGPFSWGIGGIERSLIREPHPSGPRRRAARWSHGRPSTETDGRRHRGRQGDARQSRHRRDANHTRLGISPAMLYRILPAARTANIQAVENEWLKPTQSQPRHRRSAASPLAPFLPLADASRVVSGRWKTDLRRCCRQNLPRLILHGSTGRRSPAHPLAHSNSSISAFAALRSVVSKPSLNDHKLAREGYAPLSFGPDRAAAGQGSWRRAISRKRRPAGVPSRALAGNDLRPPPRLRARPATEKARP